MGSDSLKTVASTKPFLHVVNNTVEAQRVTDNLALFYFHVNGSIGIVQKIDFEIRPDLGCSTPKSSGKVVFGNPSVCLSVCLAVCLAVAFPASSHRRKV